MATVFSVHYGLRAQLQGVRKNTRILHGFLLNLCQVLDVTAPSHVAIIFDPSGPTVRHQLHPQYKAGRPAVPDDVVEGKQQLLELLPRMCLTTLSTPGYEADDIIGTLAHRASEAGMEVVISSSDKDFLQLVGPNTTLLRPHRSTGELRRYDSARVEEEMGVRADQFLDWLSLVGDATDNIPGVPGIGEKTATKLLQHLGSLESIFNCSEDQWPKLTKKARASLSSTEGREAALFSKALISLNTDLQIPSARVPFEALQFKPPPDGGAEALQYMLEEYQLKVVANRFSEIWNLRCV